MWVGACSDGAPSVAACNANLEKIKSAQAVYFAQHGRYGTHEELVADHLVEESGPLYDIAVLSTSYTVTPAPGECANVYTSSPLQSPN